MQVSSLLTDSSDHSSKKFPPKSVSFELLLDERSKTRARIPLRVLVNTHDTTESIITTVKNFYGIYDGNGVCFEDASGNTIIASYGNLKHDTIVYVRSVAGASQGPPPFAYSSQPLANGHDSQRRPSLGEPFQLTNQHMREQSLSPTRPPSRLTHKRSASPQHGRGRRSQSQQKNGSYPGSRGSSTNRSVHGDNDYSDSEAGRSSVSGSRKARSEQFASSDISTANVLLDGRRGQPIFDSSTLPLFAPPQVPIAASQSSISPQRRSVPHEGPSPFQLPAQKFHGIIAPPMMSPQEIGQDSKTGNVTKTYSTSNTTTPVPQHKHRLRDRSSANADPGYSRRMAFGGQTVLPTPDPTVASCISDEDVARTLIALGDASNFSLGRTSNSTMDDTFSEVADAASSTGATSDSDEYSDSERGLLKHRKYLDIGDDEYDNDGIIKSEFDEYDGPPKTKKIKTKQHDGPSNIWKGPSMGMKSSKPTKVRTNSLTKPSKPALPGITKPSSTTSTTQLARKGSNSSLNGQSTAVPDEEDLSSKPRCQRCRKSKKGCDRQRPCGRCKDAGIGIEGCVSEDEGNGKKGRYGRHMGVSVKKANEPSLFSEHDDDQMIPEAAETIPHAFNPDKSKKRKR